MDDTTILNRPENDAPRESLLVKIASSFGSQLGVLIFGMGSQIIVARTLGPSGKGAFSLTLATAIMLSIFAHLSLSSANSHFAGRYPKDRRAMVGNNIFVAFIWGAIVTCGIVFLKDKIPSDYLPKINNRLFGMALVAIIPLLLLEYSNGLVLGLDWIKRLSIIRVLKEFLLLCGLWWLMVKGILSVEGAVAVWVIITVFIALLQALSAWSRIGWSITVSPGLLKRMTMFSMQSHAANVFSFLKLRFDWFLIDHFLPQSDLGYYTVAYAIIYLLWYLPFAISQVLVPFISWRDEKAGNELTPPLARLGFTVALIGAVLMALLGWPFIRLLFGENFLPAYPILLVLLPGGLIFSLARILAGDLIGRGLPKYSMIISTLSFVLNFTVNLFFIPRFGILGAAVTASISHIFGGLMFIYFFTRVSGVRIPDLLIIKREDLTGIIKQLRSR